MIAEDNLHIPTTHTRSTNPSSSKMMTTTTTTTIPTTDVTVTVDEELTVKLSRDGLIETVDVKGTLAVRVANPSTSKIQVQLNDFAGDGFQLQVHPTIARSFLQDHRLALKQADRGFPVDSAVSVLRWRQPAGGEALLPINVTCWPEMVDGGYAINAEYTLNPSVLSTLQNVRICIPLPAGIKPEISAVDGSYHYVCECDDELSLNDSFDSIHVNPSWNGWSVMFRRKMLPECWSLLFREEWKMTSSLLRWNLNRLKPS